MTASTDSNVTDFKGDAPTTAQTHYDARDRLMGRLDHATVRQAAGGHR